MSSEGIAPGIVTALLNYFGGTTPTAPAALWGQLAIDHPGAAGTANPSAVTTRQQITLTASPAGSGSPVTLSNAPAWAMTATETIGYLTVWSASSGGTFLFSGLCQVAAAVNSGDTVNLNTLGLAVLPQAA